MGETGLAINTSRVVKVSVAFLLIDTLQITGLLLLWNLAVVHNISKWVYGYSKRFEGVPAEYVGRKAVHILSGGVTTVVVSALYVDYYWLVTLSALMLAGYLYFRRKWGLMYWFQVEKNSFEIHFAIAYGAALIVGLALGDVWIGLIPMLFMSFGDSATGLVRAFRQKRQVKSWDGTIAMFLVCSVIGFWRLGWYGVFIGAAASLVERIPRLDDNVSVPIVAVLLVYLGRFI
jgi:dolichol kinase